MARLRYARAEAQAEATRRAEAFVAVRPDRDQFRHRGTFADSTAPPSRASRHPAAWVAVFAPIPPEEGIIDGGELFIAVDLESGSVAVRGDTIGRSATKTEGVVMTITVEATVAAPVEEVWRAWTTPDDIVRWNAASDDWHTTAATVDLREGGAFSSRMEAKDGSFGFDFAGTYTRIVPHELIECRLGDRVLTVEFVPAGDGVTVRETFDADDSHPVDQQRAGWQAILDRFARHVEAGR